MLSEVDRELLVSLLLGGANSPKNLSEITGRHDQSCLERLKKLEEMDLVTNKGGGVYDLTVPGANTARAVHREYSTAEQLKL